MKHHLLDDALGEESLEKWTVSVVGLAKNVEMLMLLLMQTSLLLIPVQQPTGKKLRVRMGPMVTSLGGTSMDMS